MIGTLAPSKPGQMTMIGTLEPSKPGQMTMIGGPAVPADPIIPQVQDPPPPRVVADEPQPQAADPQPQVVADEPPKQAKAQDPIIITPRSVSAGNAKSGSSGRGSRHTYGEGYSGGNGNGPLIYNP